MSSVSSFFFSLVSLSLLLLRASRESMAAANTFVRSDELDDLIPTATNSSPHASPKHNHVPVIHHAKSTLPETHYFSEETSAGVPDLEESSTHASSAVDNDIESGFLRPRLHVYDDGDDEDSEVSLATSSEIFDSAAEYMLSTANSRSPIGSFNESFAHAESPSTNIIRALSNLNELNSGVASLDRSLLENTSEQDFRFRVMEIAFANHLSLDDDVVLDILNILSPLVDGNPMQTREGRDVGEYALPVPIARPTADDDTEGSDDTGVNLTDADQSGNAEFLPYSARGLRIPIMVADDEQDDQEVLGDLLPSFPSVSVEHVLNSSTLSNQQEQFHVVSEEGPAERDGASQNIGLESGEFVAGATEHVEAYEVRDRGDLCPEHITPTSTGMPLFDSVECLAAGPVGWGCSISSLRSGISFSRLNDLTGGIDDARRKLQVLRLKLLRLALRLEQSQNNVVAQVLHRLELADWLRGGSRLTDSDLETSWLVAQEQEARGPGDLDLECTVMVLGKSGAGKSATINSLFDKEVAVTDAYKLATKKVKEIVGTVNGLKLRVIDTPGFLPSFSDKLYNLRILSSVQRYIKKSPPDIVMYVDRLDVQCRDYGDLPLFQVISGTLGEASWYNTIIVFTHGSSAPLDGPNNAPENFELFISQRFRRMQETIRRAAGDMRLKNPVSIIDNHAAFQVHGANHYTLPNGGVNKPQLLFLCFASKILSEINKILQSQGKTFWFRTQMPPLPFLFASMLQPRAHLKLLKKQFNNEEGFNFDDEEAAEEASALIDKHRGKRSLASVFMNTPDIALPRCFESGNPIYRYHVLDTSNQLLGRPVLAQNDWDHDTGYSGLSIEELFWISKKVPISVSGQITEGKKETIVELECATSVKTNDGRWMLGGLDIHPLGKDIAYILHGQTSFKSVNQHESTCGLAVTMLGDTLSAGMKLEDCLVMGKGLRLVIGGGVLTGHQKVASGAYLEASFRDKEYPTSRTLSALRLSIINWQESLVIGGNLQIQFLLGKTMIIGRVKLGNIRDGQINVKADGLKMALMGLLPLLGCLFFGRI